MDSKVSRNAPMSRGVGAFLAVRVMSAELLRSGAKKKEAARDNKQVGGGAAGP
jgi:hypothetical protein